MSNPHQPPIKAQDAILGIDLGTTNTLVAVATAQDRAKVLMERDGDPLIPSVVHFPASGPPIVGRAARPALLDDPAHTVYSAKRLLGRAGDEVDQAAQDLAYSVVRGERDLARIEVRGKRMSPEEIAAQILIAARDRAAAALSHPIRRAVITVPAYFDDAQRQATKDAAQLAGLECLRIINEPTAAALAYGIDGHRDGTVLVYDLGGGTFDVSILKISDGVFRVLSTAGDTRLGGDDFDRLLYERLLAHLEEELGITRDQLDDAVSHELRRAAEGLKVRLSDADEVLLDIAVGEQTAQLRVGRTEFEAAIEPLVQRTVARCHEALQDAGLTPEQLDDVVLVGGSTRVPRVREAIRGAMDQPPRTDVDPDQAVALGAALQGAVLGGSAGNLLLLDVIPLSLGIETMGGVVSKLILRNSTIPTTASEEFSTQVDNQTGVDINIFQGEREMVADCRHLGSFKLTGIPPMPAGLPRVKVTFLVDADGVLTVRAVESRTGTEAGIQVVPSFGLTREEVSRIMHESIEHAIDDMQAREAVEVRNKAQAMVVGTQKALDMADLPPDQVYTIRKGLKQLQKLVEGGAPLDQLKPAVDDLSKLTATVADDVISSAVAKALSEEN